MMKILLAMPYCGQINQDAARSFYQQASKEHEIDTASKNFSALASCFNHLWISALAYAQERGYTHFAMLHSDISAEPWWLDKLVAQIEDYKLHVLSAVVPIKDDKGLTSTAVGPIVDIWDQQRLTLKECAKLPPVFVDKDLERWKKENNRQGQFLLLNTGCWIADLRTNTWWDKEEDGSMRFCFTQKDRLLNPKPGHYQIQFAPEDWLFSRACHRSGLRIGATRSIEVEHHGGKKFDNSTWGTWTTDIEAKK